MQRLLACWNVDGDGLTVDPAVQRDVYTANFLHPSLTFANTVLLRYRNVRVYVVADAPASGGEAANQTDNDASDGANPGTPPTEDDVNFLGVAPGSPESPRPDDGGATEPPTAPNKKRKSLRREEEEEEGEQGGTKARRWLHFEDDSDGEKVKGEGE